MVNNKWFLWMLLLIIATITACSNNEIVTKDSPYERTPEEPEYNPPSTDDLDPEDPMTEYIKLGEKAFNETNTVLSDEVGNELSCASCHADGGTGKGSSMVGVATQFPQYRSREGDMFTLSDRINGCMIRSMNGEKLDRRSDELRGMVAYLTYISEGIDYDADIPWRMQNNMEKVPEPDVARGEELYSEKNCMSCHAQDGSGTGATSGPALWGDNSFNDGAGMTRLSKMSGYLKRNMPPGDGENLTDQEAADLAAYILSHERPVWEGHENDWPKGGRPTDIITQDRREKIRNGEFDWTEIENVVPAD
ncbi:thiosulfate dehydrogenase [Thalassobacillus cyri]|uniref:Thiosulfate dehydrogenase n=1 Tax=Thalassobacillus cyri TaxID=571932 RepID=A0A1H4EG22_9BACI|nr:c-type cytochrome [Thalassobacillus cyri]SEA84011.1 thiosulfate dehydrogenase [Thalassobacillus cyri]